MAFRKWYHLDTSIVTSNPWWSYMLDHYRIEGGYMGEYHYVHTPGSVMIVPETGMDFLLVRQYRYLNKRESLEFPAGGMPEGMTPEDAAVKELIEETGYSAGLMCKTGEFNPYNGVTDEICHVFSAGRLTACESTPDPMEDFELCRMSAADIDHAIENGTIWDGMTIAAWFIAKFKRSAR
jgi:ADP-ribose pyrophosphatase